MADSGNSKKNLIESVTNDEMRALIKMEVIAGTPPAEVHRKLVHLVGKKTFDRTYAYRLYNQFVSGERVESVLNYQTGRPKTATSSYMQDKVLEILIENDGKQWKFHMNWLGFHYAKSSWVPHELKPEDQKKRMDLAKSHLKRLNKEKDLLDRIIAIDETWLEAFTSENPAMAGAWAPPGEPGPLIVRAQRQDWKLGAVVAFWKREVLTYDFVEPKERMNGNRFLAFLKEILWPAIYKKGIKRPVLLMDNARYHFTSDVREFIRLRKWDILGQSPYSPDQNPCDSHGFRQIKAPLRGRRFDSVDSLKSEFNKISKQISENKSFSGITQLPETWQAIINGQGIYVH